MARSLRTRAMRGPAATCPAPAATSRYFSMRSLACTMGSWRDCWARSINVWGRLEADNVCGDTKNAGRRSTWLERRVIDAGHSGPKCDSPLAWKAASTLSMSSTNGLITIPHNHDRMCSMRSSNSISNDNSSNSQSSQIDYSREHWGHEQES